MPKKNEPKAKNEAGTEMMPLYRPSPSHATNVDEDQAWEDVASWIDTGDAADSMAGNATAVPHDTSWWSQAVQLTSNVFSTTSAAIQSTQDLLSSARNDFDNGSPYPGRMTNWHLAQSTSGMPYPLAFLIREGFGVGFSATQHILSALPDISSAVWQPYTLSFAPAAANAALLNTTLSAPAASGQACAGGDDTSGYGLSEQARANELQAYLLAIDPDLDMIDCEEPQDAPQDDEDSDDSSDSEESSDSSYFDAHDPEDSDDGGDNTSSTTSQRSAPAQEGAARPPEDATTAAQHADTQAPQGDQTLALSFLLDAGAPGALADQSGNGWLSDTGFGLPAPAVALGIAAAGYLIFNDVPDWGSISSHCSPELGQIFSAILV